MHLEWVSQCWLLGQVLYREAKSKTSVICSCMLLDWSLDNQDTVDGLVTSNYRYIHEWNGFGKCCFPEFWHPLFNVHLLFWTKMILFTVLLDFGARESFLSRSRKLSFFLYPWVKNNAQNFEKNTCQLPHPYRIWTLNLPRLVTSRIRNFHIDPYRYVLWARASDLRDSWHWSKVKMLHHCEWKKTGTKSWSIKDSH